MMEQIRHKVLSDIKGNIEFNDVAFSVMKREKKL